MGKTTVYLGRLPYSARHRDIEDFFRGYGKIFDINLKSGFAFVEFYGYRDAEDAVEDLHGKRILGERVMVEFAKESSRGSASRLEYRRSSRHYSRRSRSRSPSRSRSHRKRSRSRSKDRSKRRSRSPLAKKRKERRRSRSTSRSTRSSSRSRTPALSTSKKSEKKSVKEKHRSRKRSHSPYRRSRYSSKRSNYSSSRSPLPGSSSSNKRGKKIERIRRRSRSKSPHRQRSRSNSSTSHSQFRSRRTVMSIAMQEEEEEPAPSQQYGPAPPPIDDDILSFGLFDRQGQPGAHFMSSSSGSSQTTPCNEPKSNSPDLSTELINEHLDVLWMEQAEENVKQEKDKRNESKLSLCDLPDDILLNIIKLADLGKGLRLRVNKKTEERVHSLLNLQTIALKILAQGSVLTVADSKKSWDTLTKADDLWSVCQLVQGLKRWSTNTYVHRIMIDIQAPFDEHIGEAIKALCQFEADSLMVHTELQQQLVTNRSAAYLLGYANTSNSVIALPKLDMPTLLVLSANIREVWINVACEVEVTDLLFLWNSLVNGGCKLEMFSIRIKEGMRDAFVDLCFHINIKTTYSKVYERSIEFECPPLHPHPAKLYCGQASFNLEQIHFTDNLMTEMKIDRITFKKIDAEEKTNLLKTLNEIIMNQPYEIFERY